MGGISGGAFLLARAGLMKNRRLTLHWVYASAFAEEFPDADLRRSLYEIDNDRMTCGGGMSPHRHAARTAQVPARRRLALRVADWFLHTGNSRGTQAAAAVLSSPPGRESRRTHPGSFGDERALEEPLSRGALAKIAGVSERQLDRLFLSQVGTALGVYYLQLRLERARQLSFRARCRNWILPSRAASRARARFPNPIVDCSVCPPALNAPMPCGAGGGTNFTRRAHAPLRTNTDHEGRIMSACAAGNGPSPPQPPDLQESVGAEQLPAGVRALAS